MIPAIDRKLLRDLWHVRGQAFAIAAVIASGVALFIGELATQESLFLTRADYYAQYRFGEVFASCKRAPNTLASRIAAIEGVQTVQTRVVNEVSLDVPNLAEPAIGRVVGVPRERRPELNDLFLRQGRYFESGDHDCVLAGEGFVKANNLNPGDSFMATINGRKRRLTLIGVALSPEYIYSLRAGEFIPDDKRFGVLWMAQDEVASAFDMEGAFNDVSLTLSQDAREREVIARLDQLLEPYGGLGAIPRADQTSHWYLNNELVQLQTLGTAMPLIFLGVAAFLLNVVLTRLISVQREQIAALKAFGYSNLAVGWHYMKLVLLIVALGTAAGALIGAWLGSQLVVIYTEFYKFPFLRFVLSPQLVVYALLITGAASALGALSAVRAAVVLPPAEAMRPPAPGKYRPMLFERLGLQPLFSQPMRMILRQLERRPLKAMFSVLGIAMGVAIFIVGFFFVDTIDFLMDAQFNRMQREDVTVTFNSPKSARSLHEIASMPGVLRVEPFRIVPATLRNENHFRQSGIIGVSRDSDLHRVLDAKLRPLSVPSQGVALSRKLGQVLNVREGDSLWVEIKEGARPKRQIVVAQLVDDFLGLSAYMELGALNELMRESDSVSGAYLSIDPRHSEALYAKMKVMPGVSGISVKEATITSFREMLAQNILIITTINVLFAAVIAFGVVYNNARVSLSERARELASLRVLGLTRAEISYILLGELALMVLAAIPLGCVIGYFMAKALLVFFMDIELMRFPLVIAPRTYAWAALVVIVSAIVSGLAVRRKLDHLDLVEVLKTRE